MKSVHDTAARVTEAGGDIRVKGRQETPRREEENEAAEDPEAMGQERETRLRMGVGRLSVVDVAVSLAQDWGVMSYFGFTR